MNSGDLAVTPLDKLCGRTVELTPGQKMQELVGGP